MVLCHIMMFIMDSSFLTHHVSHLLITQSYIIVLLKRSGFACILICCPIYEDSSSGVATFIKSSTAVRICTNLEYVRLDAIVCHLKVSQKLTFKL